MARTIIFHENGDLILDVPEHLPSNRWNTDAYVFIHSQGGSLGWYKKDFSSGRGVGSLRDFNPLEEDEVPAVIKLKLLLLL